jgi:hypothetical protein
MFLRHCSTTLCSMCKVHKRKVVSSHSFNPTYMVSPYLKVSFLEGNSQVEVNPLNEVEVDALDEDEEEKENVEDMG